MNKKTTKRDIGLVIELLRKTRGLSQKELAKKLNPNSVSTNTISRIETGNYNYTIDMLFRIADILDCDISNFFGSQQAPSKVGMFEEVLEEYAKRVVAEEKAKYKNK